MTKDQKVIRAKDGLLELAKQLGNVSQACKIMGYSRDSFYRYRELYEKGGEAALAEIYKAEAGAQERRRRRDREGHRGARLEQPAYGQVRISNELRKRGLIVSPGGVRRLAAPQPGDHEETPESFGSQGRPGGVIHTEGAGNLRSQGRKAAASRSAYGQCGAQDTFYVGKLKGVGRIYQQTFVDTYTRVAFAKLYDRKTALTAADRLNDRVVPFFEEEGVDFGAF